ATKPKGPPYIVQRAAAAVYTTEGQKQGRGLVDCYMHNARTLREGLERAGLTVYGGRNAPYIWVRTPAGVSSWDFFDRLPAGAQGVGRPGSGVGPGRRGVLPGTALGPPRRHRRGGPANRDAPARLAGPPAGCYHPAVIKVVTCIKRKPGMSVEDFQAYWRGSHPEVVVRLPGIRRYIQSHTLR